MGNKSLSFEQATGFPKMEIDKTEYDRLKEAEFDLKKIKEELSETKKVVGQLQKLLVDALSTQPSSSIPQNQNITPAIRDVSSAFGNIFQDNIEDKNEKTVKPSVKIEGTYKTKYEEILQKTQELTRKQGSAK